MIRRGCLALTAGALLLSILTFYRWNSLEFARPVLSERLEPKLTLILDAGHGGEDGGAVSLSGVPESNINLSVVLKTEEILGLYGVCPVLTRREDISLHDGSAVTLREKKRSDLENRLRLVEEVGGGVLLSIHQNSYPDGRYHGAQAFYGPTDGSEELAAHMQHTVAQALQPGSTREHKPIPDTVYLMNHVTCTAVLLECGFLTNPEEEALLTDPAYQTKLAAAVAWGWLTAPV